jgi:hypothetical protein
MRVHVKKKTCPRVTDWDLGLRPLLAHGSTRLAFGQENNLNKICHNK